LRAGYGTEDLTRIVIKPTKWWAVIFLPILLRALIPVGFMPMVGPGFSVRMVVCDGYAPVPWTAAMPADMPMDMGTSSSDLHGGAPVHDDHGSCPYGSAPALGALLTLASLPALLIQRGPERLAAAAQVPRPVPNNTNYQCLRCSLSTRRGPFVSSTQIPTTRFVWVPMRFGRQHDPSPRSNERGGYAAVESKSTPGAEAMTDDTAYTPPKVWT